MVGVQFVEAEAERRAALKDLQRVPGIGPRVAADLYAMGYRSVAALRGQNPERLYEELCAHQGFRVDRCMLYVFRCAVYFATNERPDPHLLKWWRWKDPEQVRA
ncbi:MAG: helix-hairpin-helix domain-containing protein [Anaerolineae bacterium]|nr:helix-hairpin-helix domain-containing protein [Anaerolineae bacterium]